MFERLLLVSSNIEQLDTFDIEQIKYSLGGSSSGFFNIT